MASSGIVAATRSGSTGNGAHEKCTSSSTVGIPPLFYGTRCTDIAYREALEGHFRLHGVHDSEFLRW